mmetsp:Transcript_79030/g.189839  ORF Transcript_79030/g.189839 Transcript_79030/m.189839 type:complete len:208 (-) Transcript_79030:447-1070(-)
MAPLLRSGTGSALLGTAGCRGGHAERSGCHHPPHGEVRQAHRGRPGVRVQRGCAARAEDVAGLHRSPGGIGVLPPGCGGAGHRPDRLRRGVWCRNGLPVHRPHPSVRRDHSEAGRAAGAGDSALVQSQGAGDRHSVQIVPRCRPGRGHRGDHEHGPDRCRHQQRETRRLAEAVGSLLREGPERAVHGQNRPGFALHGQGPAHHQSPV